MPRSFIARIGLICCVGAIAILVGLSAAVALKYPPAQRGDQADDYFGTVVKDPYRWLENDVREDPAVEAWVEAENEVTFGYLHAIPQRQPIIDRLTKLWNYERYDTPFKKGGRYFYTHNDGLQNQSVVFMMDKLGDDPKVLFDPNTWSGDATVALAGESFSSDGKYVAYALAESGSDWRTWKVRTIATGDDLEEEIHWVKWASPVWTPDNAGFYYCRYDAPEENAEFQESNLNSKMFYHKVGTPQDADVLVYERPDEPEWDFSPNEITEGSHYMAVSIWKAGRKNLVYYMDVNDPESKPTELIGGWDADYACLGSDGTNFYFQTDNDAPNGRVIAVDLTKPDRANWITIVPESDDALKSAGMVGDYLMCEYMHDATTLVKQYKISGEFVRDVELPGLGTASGFSGERSDTETFYSFRSFTTPTSIYRYDLATGTSTLFRETEVGIDTEKYELKQVFFNSKDGTRIPMFILSKKGLVLDGNNPLILYGYGGFKISRTPYFSVTNLAWVEMGGVYVEVNLRGGGEYGEEWHQAGMKLNKQNVFDDFIGAAEWLIANKYTSKEKIACKGASNGGLLVGAVETQRPDLWGACIPEVGVMDMLRFHKFTAGRYWTDDYGSSDDPDQFKALYAYSPYHNIKAGTKYPPTLITTADHDDRVVPGHSFKFAAEMQHDQAGDAPILIRIETKAGHGAGTPTSKLIEHYADIYAFLCANLGVTLPEEYGS